MKVKLKKGVGVKKFCIATFQDSTKSIRFNKKLIKDVFNARFDNNNFLWVDVRGCTGIATYLYVDKTKDIWEVVEQKEKRP